MLLLTILVQLAAAYPAVSTTSTTSNRAQEIEAPLFRTRRSVIGYRAHRNRSFSNHSKEFIRRNVLGYPQFSKKEFGSFKDRRRSVKILHLLKN